MGIENNPYNKPDIYGYEQKKESKKITFIDKQTDEKYYKGKSLGKNPNKDLKKKYWYTFERSNSKQNRIGGWKLNKWIDGQCMIVDKNDINVIYNYTRDNRQDKEIRVSNYYKDCKNHIICVWKKETLEKCINNKFNVKGFYIIKKNNEGEYNKICFGKKIDFEYWISEFVKKNIYYDGYSKLDGRWRGTFRASGKWWNNLITEEYS